VAPTCSLSRAMCGEIKSPNALAYHNVLDADFTRARRRECCLGMRNAVREAEGRGGTNAEV